jgi:hypothetical protein
MNLHIQPSLDEIAASARQQPEGVLFGHGQRQWREKTRLELGLETDRPIIATGHQTLLWHPGILAKYMVMDAVADAHDFGRANLIVDQHVDHFGVFDVPLRRSDGSLAVRSIELAPSRKDVPMGLQRTFSPQRDPMHLSFASDSVAQGVQQILHAVRQHQDAPNAALQMAMVLSDLMARWVKPVTHVTATDLGQTSLSRALLQAMVDDPHACAHAYNTAVAAISDAGIGTLLVRDDYVELPLWRIREDGRRMRAYDNDVQRVLDDPMQSPLLPRALFMTALVRLGMCDVFIHGTGGANYDRAMELWIHNWLGVQVAPVAVATATLHLPLMNDQQHMTAEQDSHRTVEQALHAARHAWHDPEAAAMQQQMGARKAELLQMIDALPRRSTKRKAAFFEMHRVLDELRTAHHDVVMHASQRAEQARRMVEDARIARRRDWPFPLYPIAMIDQLSQVISRADVSDITP